MDKPTISRAFNTHFFEFLDDIIAIFPENLDIQASKTSFETVKRANPTAILKSWFTYVYHPYKVAIDAGNIQFFFNKNYEEDLAVLSDAKYIMSVINTLRGPIKMMSLSSQENTMKYIQNLSKLSAIYSTL